MAELERVLDMCPWTFNNQALILDRLKGYNDPRDVPLHLMFIWVQVHGLKRGFFSEQVAQRLGNEIGEFMESDPKNYSNPWATYLRIRVELDVRKPLRKGTKMKREGEDWFHVSFAYERLPTFCFVCGCLGHGEKFCPIVSRNWGKDVARQYGPELRALSKRSTTGIGSKWLRDELLAFKKEAPASTNNANEAEHHNSDTLMQQMQPQANGIEGQATVMGGSVHQEYVVISDPKKRKIDMKGNGDKELLLSTVSDSKNVKEAGPAMQAHLKQ
ncbi:unnamed protein product [Cuscuta campestris]|uniref:Zinc knuckle CX2CX4HX4C domain-containing protein n=1 Tax=Cuscuta campestris TaxID=132261 RepID=A0A484KXR8_9ASTE|nr:unnamed protein product [Cuscuta campestris]